MYEGYSGMNRNLAGSGQLTWSSGCFGTVTFQCRTKASPIVRTNCIDSDRTVVLAARVWGLYGK